MKLHKTFVFRGNIHSIQSQTTHVFVHGFTEFSLNAKHFQLFEVSQKSRLFCRLVKNIHGLAPVAAFDILSALMLNTCSTKRPVMTAKQTPWMLLWLKRSARTDPCGMPFLKRRLWLTTMVNRYVQFIIITEIWKQADSLKACCEARVGSVVNYPKSNFCNIFCYWKSFCRPYVLQACYKPNYKWYNAQPFFVFAMADCIMFIMCHQWVQDSNLDQCGLTTGPRGKCACQSVFSGPRRH